MRDWASSYRPGCASPSWLDTAAAGPLWWLHSPCLLPPGQSSEVVSPPCSPLPAQHPWPTFMPIHSGKPTPGSASLPVGAQLYDVGPVAHPLCTPGLSPATCPLEAPAYPQYLQPASCLKQHRSSCVSTMQALGLWSPSPRRDRTQGRATGVPQEPGLMWGAGRATTGLGVWSLHDWRREPHSLVLPAPTPVTQSSVPGLPGT